MLLTRHLGDTGKHDSVILTSGLHAVNENRVLPMLRTQASKELHTGPGKATPSAYALHGHSQRRVALFSLMTGRTRGWPTIPPWKIDAPCPPRRPPGWRSANRRRSGKYCHCLGGGWCGRRLACMVSTPQQVIGRVKEGTYTSMSR